MRTRTARRVELPDLDQADLDLWHRLHRTVPEYDSPYFHPEFARALHETGERVSVVVRTDTDAGATTALMPFHRRRSRMLPLGSPGADFQGPLITPGSTLDPLELLTPGLQSLEFDHLLEVGDTFEPWITSRRVSPYVETAGGMAGYLDRASKSGKQNMSQARRRTAKAERELGTVRFEADVVDDKLLDRVVDLKRSQYRATGARDYFADGRRIAFVRRLLHTRQTSFGGILSAVWAGDHLLAAHFGLRAGSVLHWWFPVYDPAFAPLAPGWMLLRELVTAAPELGVSRIDLGRGEDNYKRWAKTGEVVVCQGFMSSSPVRIAARAARTRLRRTAKESAIGPRLRRVAQGWRTRTGASS